MEPLTTAAVALGTVVGTKVLEKTGENLGEALWNKGTNFLESLKQESPDTVTAIERVAEQPDYLEVEWVEVVQKVQSLAAANPDVAGSMQE